MNFFIREKIARNLWRGRAKIASCRLYSLISKFSGTLIRLKSIKVPNLVALRRDCENEQIARVADQCSYRAVAPSFSGHPTAAASFGIYNSINAYRLRGVITNPYSPVFSASQRLIFPDNVLGQAGRIQTDAAGIYKEDSRIFRINQFSQRLRRGVHIGGAGAFNWFHFLLECLPKLLFIQKLPTQYQDYPLLLPIEAADIANFRQALDVLAKGREAFFLSKSERVLVDDLIVFDEISSAPYNMTEGSWPVLADYQQHDRVVLEWISTLREALLPESSVPLGSQRLFMVRPGDRRGYNQAELIEIASRYGFEPVSPELLSLPEQAALFSRATMIVGASGAAWVGMIFAQQRIAGLSWLPSVYRQFCSYSTLASLLGHRLQFIECLPDYELLSTGDAYNANYTVPPHVFEKSLQEMIDQCP
jgi:hypothetical protein